MEGANLFDRMKSVVQLGACRLILAGLFLASFATGCANGEDDMTEDGRVIVEYWEKWTSFERDAMQSIVDDFNASQDRIAVRMLTVSGIDRKMLLATAGGNPPDVAGIFDFNINDYAEKNALMPLDRLCAESGIKEEDYIPSIWATCVHKGHIWALPSTPASLALLWNKKMFRDAGLNPEKPPRSIEELDVMSEKLTRVEVERKGETVEIRFDELTPEEREAKTFKLTQLGYSPSEPGWWNAMLGFWFGGSLWDGDRTITLDSPENIAAFRWFQSYPEKFGKKNLELFGSSFGNFASPQNPFLGGKVAMVMQGVWMHNFIETYAPDLEWGAAPVPSVDAENLPMVTIALSDVLVIPKGARHTEEAFEFIRFVNTKASLEKLNLGQMKFSPLLDVSPGFVKNHPNPYIQVFIDLAKSDNARLTPRMSMWSECRDEMSVTANQIFTLIETPENALRTARERAQKQLDRATTRWDKVKEKREREWAKL